MILFKKDWEKYPSAIPDKKTNNGYFLDFAAKLYREAGVENCLWPISLLNPEIQGLDPFSPKSYVKEYRKKFPKKYAAHLLVNNRLRDGKLEKKCCEICGSEKSVAHHDDYDKPLEVRWLCPIHHKQWHSSHGEALNAT